MENKVFKIMRILSSNISPITVERMTIATVHRAPAAASGREAASRAAGQTWLLEGHPHLTQVPPAHGRAGVPSSP